jgi:hypothetical protein
MDDFMVRHLEAWLDHAVLEDERDVVRASIVAFVLENPDVLADRSWPEIRRLAEG